MVVLLNDEESNIEIHVEKFVWFTDDGSLAKTVLIHFHSLKIQSIGPIIMFKIQRFIMCGTLFKSKYESV